MLRSFLKRLLGRDATDAPQESEQRTKSRAEIHAYWKKPWDGANPPEAYLSGSERCELLLRLMKEHAPASPSILEVGCNVGRNLEALRQAGYDQLSAIEISKEALDVMKSNFPDLAQVVDVKNAPIEEVVGGFGDQAFDVVFSMAVLEHIHPESEWVFQDLARVTKRLLVTIEDEEGVSWRHFPRNYSEIFTNHGMTQIHRENCEGIEGLGRKFFATIFTPA